VTDNVDPTPELNPAASRADPAAAPADPAIVAAPADPAVAVVGRPADLPESFWDAEAKAPKYGDIAARLTRADELEAAETSRKEGVPAEAKDYKFEPAGDPILGLDGQAAGHRPGEPAGPGRVRRRAEARHAAGRHIRPDPRLHRDAGRRGEGAEGSPDAEAAKLGDKAGPRHRRAELHQGSAATTPTRPSPRSGRPAPSRRGRP
jgi:hypothetical protein